MLKLFLCIGIISSGAVIGLHFSSKLRKRRDTLQKLSDMLGKAVVMMDYTCKDLCELFSDNFAGFEFVRDKPFDTQWLSFINGLSDSLNKDDITLFKDIIKELGTTDISSQQRYSQIYAALIEEQISKAQSDIDAKSKLYRVIPLSAGLIISILIV